MASLAIASGTSSVQAITGRARILGYSVRETADTPAAATVVLRDGTATSAPARLFVELAGSGSQTARTPVIDFETGVYVHREAGSSEIVLYLG